MNRVVAIIPARMASTRFPGKPLAMISGKPMILRVFERVMKAADIDDVYVATDSKEIKNLIENVGGKALITDYAPTGTDRCFLALKTLNITPEVVLNVQGDEPVISPDLLTTMVRLIKSTEHDVITPYVQKSNSEIDKHVTIAASGNKAIYFSRSPIPNGSEYKKKHIGVYAMKYDAIQSFYYSGPLELEVHEKLEQLRFLELGLSIGIVEANSDSVPVDVESDIKTVEAFLINS